MGEQCDGCRFWKPEERKRPEHDGLTGDCRRFPPVLNPEVVRLSAAESGGDSSDAVALGGEWPSWVFPITSHDDWCGEFRAKDAPPGA